jgi:hypothetical protein
MCWIEYLWNRTPSRLKLLAVCMARPTARSELASDFLYHFIRTPCYPYPMMSPISAIFFRFSFLGSVR